MFKVLAFFVALLLASFAYAQQPYVPLGPTFTVGGGIGFTPSSTGVTANTLIAKAAPGLSYQVYYTQRSTATEAYLVGVNSVTVPPDGAITPSLVVECYPVGATGVSAISSSMAPKTYSLGVVYFVTAVDSTSVANRNAGAVPSCTNKITTGTVSGFLSALIQ